MSGEVVLEVQSYERKEPCSKSGRRRTGHDRFVAFPVAVAPDLTAEEVSRRLNEGIPVEGKKLALYKRTLVTMSEPVAIVDREVPVILRPGTVRMVRNWSCPVVRVVD